MPFSIERNDLATVSADALVVPANEHLQITGGVGLMVAQVAGLDDLQAACDEIGFCSCGSAVATPAFRLPAKVVVHAVGPVWKGGKLGEAGFLRSAYDAALECAVDADAHSIALPLISAGTFGFPADVSLAVARESIRAFLNRHDDIEVRLVLYSRESVAAGMAAYLDIAEYVDDHYVDAQHAWGMAPQAEPDWFAERGMPDAAPARFASAPAAPRAAAPAPTESGRGPLGRLGSALSGKFRKREDVDDAAPLLDADAAMPDAAMPAPAPIPAPSAVKEPASARGGNAQLAELLDSLDAPFSTTLLALIDERGMTDAQVYKRANMSRQLFSKIRSDAGYRPTKKTALALAVALGLDLDETSDLLARAGFALSNSSKADVIVEYFIAQGNYDIFQINEALYAFDQPLL